MKNFDSKKNKYIKYLAFVGTLLIWIPILAPVLLTLILLLKDGIFRFDFLMPAELFPLAFIGGIILVWWSRKISSFQKRIAWSFGTAIAALVGSQAIAVVTGISSGEREASGLFFVLIILVYIIYLISHVMLGVYSIKFLRNKKD